MYDRRALSDLFEYTTFTWEAYGRAVARLPEGALTREAPGSGWPALRDVLFHLATAWDWWLARRIGMSDPAEGSAEDIGTWDDLRAYREKVRGWLRRAIDDASDEDLAARTEPVFEGTPAKTNVTAGEIIAHILLHERGHHGDVSTLLSQLGAQPPPIDYLTYVFFRERAR
jgi:uncharacterized damage-inducible protein DinB